MLPQRCYPSLVVVVNVPVIKLQARLEPRPGVAACGDDVGTAAQLVVVVAFAKQADAGHAPPTPSCGCLTDVEVVANVYTIIPHTRCKILGLGRGTSNRDSAIFTRLLVTKSGNMGGQLPDDGRRDRGPPRVVNKVGESGASSPTVGKSAVVVPDRNKGIADDQLDNR